MKLWIDDVRPAPEGCGYVTCYSVNAAKTVITAWEMGILSSDYQEEMFEVFGREIELIDTDHDAGDFACDGGDYIKLLDWLEETGRNYPIRIHSANAVGVQNMRRIIERTGWKEVF